MKYIVTIIAAVFFSLTTQSQGLYTLNYTMGFTSGKTADYITNASFRGFTFDGRGFISDEFSVGGLINWNTFYEKLAGATYTDGTATLTGTQYRYLNVIPMLVQAHYYVGYDRKKPRAYLGAGLGPYKMIQRVEVGLWSLEENNWHFGVSPELGILYPFGTGAQLNINCKYHYVFKASDTIDFSWFGLSVGFAWGD